MSDTDNTAPAPTPMNTGRAVDSQSIEGAGGVELKPGAKSQHPSSPHGQNNKNATPATLATLAPATPAPATLTLVPMTLRESNDFVEQFHRHNGRTAWNGGRFAIGCSNGDGLVGVAIVGNPLARAFMDGYTAEVLRVCTNTGEKNVCSKLYGACWRAWKAMGGRRLVTYTLQSESGSSLKGAGWKIVAECKPHKDGWNSSSRERDWQPIYGQLKFRWEAQDG